MNEKYESERNQIPKLGDEVYLIYKDEIYKEKVYAVGEDFFMIKDYMIYKDQSLREIKFNAKGKIWFYDLSDAIETVMDNVGAGYEVVECEDDFWCAKKIN